MANNKKLNLKNDVIFKTFFSRKGNEQFLIDFLNAILEIEIKKIEIRDEVNLEQLAKEEKGGRLDLQATLNDGVIVSIEMQLKRTKDFRERTTFYGAKVLVSDAKRGDKYDKIKEIVMINILDYELFDNEDYISKTVTVLDKHRECEVITGMKWYFIELPKFRKKRPDLNEKINQWLVFLDDFDKEGIKMAEEKNETLKKARIEMNYLTGDEEVRRLAELREKWAMDRASDMDEAREEGERIGEEKSRKEGEMVGRDKEKIEMAKEMLKKDLPIELIKEVTKLTKEKIKELEKENKK